MGERRVLLRPKSDQRLFLTDILKDGLCLLILHEQISGLGKSCLFGVQALFCLLTDRFIFRGSRLF